MLLLLALTSHPNFCCLHYERWTCIAL